MKNKEQQEWENWKKENGRQPDEFTVKLAAAAALFLVIVIGSGFLFLLAGAESVTFNINDAFALAGKCVLGGALLFIGTVVILLLIPDGRTK